MTFWWILYIIDFALFIPAAITVIYFLVFAVCSLFRHESRVAKSKNNRRFIVLVPSYRSDDHILDTVTSMLSQTYAQRNFDIVVTSDHQGELVNMRLAQLPITLLTPNFTRSSRLKSLQYAMLNLPRFKIYDAVIILNAGDIVEPDFLEMVNDAYESAGTKVIQTHRLARNRNVSIARLDSVFEEINNNVFRRGHLAVGLSAALCSSGCVFDFQWFKQAILKMRSQAGVDKELEAQLMHTGIFVDYFDGISFYSLKSTTLGEFSERRSRWTFLQMRALVRHIHRLPGALLTRRHDETDKLLQWMLVPRTILMGVISIMSVVLPFIYFSLAIKWWVVAAVSIVAYALATPNYLIDKNWNRDFLLAPLVATRAVLGLFHKGGSDDSHHPVVTGRRPGRLRH